MVASLVMIRDASGVQRNIVRWFVRDASATLKEVRTAYLRNSTGTKQYFSSFTASVSPETLTGYGYSPGTAHITTDQATAVTSGGLSPFTYAWTIDNGSWSIQNPSSATTAFSVSVVAGDQSTATATVTVTDATGQAIPLMVSLVALNQYEPG